MNHNKPQHHEEEAAWYLTAEAHASKGLTTYRSRGPPYSHLQQPHGHH